MARIFKIKDLEARKRALVEECDLYRQTLRFEIDNLRLHTTWVKRRATWLTLTPLWPLVPQLLKLFVKKKRPTGKWRWFSTMLVGWQLYQKVARYVPGIFFRGRRVRLSEEHATGRI